MTYRPKAIRLPIIGKASSVYVTTPKKPKLKLGVPKAFGYVGRHRSKPSVFKPFGSWL